LSSIKELLIKERIILIKKIIGGLQMKPAGIEKDEIMLLLTDINNQLEQLEADLHSSTNEFQKDWYDSQVNRLETCEEKLTALEVRMPEIERNENELNIKYPVKNLPTLELGF
jgi:ATP-dependent protease HslVU (ClpYQ) peptidase subunit